MKVSKVVSGLFQTLHWVNTDKYHRVSKCKTLCGLNSKQVWQPMAIYFTGAKKCKTCEKLKIKYKGEEA